MNETWKPVVGFPGYEVSDMGRVRSYLYLRGRGKAANLIADTPRIVNPTFDSDGYPHICVSRDRKQYPRNVHRLVLEAFVGPRPDGMVCAHKNGIRDDNRLENLRWATQRENHDDRRAHGRSFRGERNGSNKITEAQARAIRADKRSSLVIAQEYGIERSHVCSIRTGRAWKWLKDSVAV